MRSLMTPGAEAWWPPSPTAAAAWAQAIGVLVSLALSGWVLRRQRQDRREDRDREARRLPQMVTGWVQRPRRHQPSMSSLCWRLAGTVTNKSDTAVWDVQVRLLDPGGSPVPTPVLVRDVLPPGEDWALWWTTGHAFSPFPGPGEEPAPLPVPRVIADPAARLQLEVMFTDAAGRRWRRAGASLTPSTEDTPVSASSQVYSRAVDHLADLGEHQDEVPGGPGHALLADLHQVLDEAGREYFGPVYQPATPDLAAGTPMTAGLMASLLIDDPNTWVIAGSSTEQLDGVRVLAGALHALNQFLSVGEAGGRSARELTGQVCSVLTALGAVTRRS